MKQYDAIIIGFGKAGKTLAAELSNRGWQVAVVERSSMMYGGTCPNIACIPTKTLVHEAGIAALLYHDDYPRKQPVPFLSIQTGYRPEKQTDVFLKKQ